MCALEYIYHLLCDFKDTFLSASVVGSGKTNQDTKDTNKFAEMKKPYYRN